MYPGLNPVNLHPYAAQRKMGQLKPDEKKWAFGPLSKLQALARAMGYLVSNPDHTLRFLTCSIEG
jgi:hypothetical protein